MTATVDAAAFDWSEVNCFLRPQYLACEELAPAHGALFVFLASQERAHALRPALPDSIRHGAESHGAFRTLTGIEFRVTQPPVAGDVLASVKRALDDGPVILPVAPGHLEYLPAASPRNELHHVTLRAFDRTRGAFVALDNVPFHRDQKSVAYEQVSIGEAALDRAIRDAYDASSGADGDGGRWLLQIRRGLGFVERHPAAVARLMVSEYRRLTQTRSPDQLLPIEELHLAGLRDATRDGGRRLASLVREYLADCNFCGVHLRLAVHACNSLQPNLDPDLDALVEQTLTRARSTRSHSLVNCLSSVMTEQDWAVLRARLGELISPLQRRLAVAARELV